MPPNFSKNFANITSAAPKEKIENNIADTMVGKRDIRYTFSVVLCVAAVIATVGAYGMNMYFDRKVLSVGERINSQKEAIQLDTINDLITFDKQIKVLKDLALSRSGYLTLLRGVSAVVIDGVRYNSADFSLDESGTYTVKIQGTASSPEVYLTQLEVIREMAKKDTDVFARRISFDTYNIQRNLDGSSTVSFSMNMRIPAAEFVSVGNNNQTL